MKSFTAKEIKKTLYGVVATDGCVRSKEQKFNFYTKSKQLSDDITTKLQSISGMQVRYKYDSKNDGHRVWTTKHPYWKYMAKHFYTNRKVLTSYTCNRFDEVSLAYMWMCDGYLEHAKNRKTNKIQNIGWFCLEAFPKEELEIFQKRLQFFGVDSSLTRKPWGFGYRVRIGGENLQKFLSLVYPHLLSDFHYKSVLFYKTEKAMNLDLPSAGHIFKLYKDCEDIVRYSK